MTTQRIEWPKSVWLKCVDLGSRPAFWLAALLLWALVSATRSLGTPWAAAAETEALRWTAGIGLALALGMGLRRTELAGQLIVLLTGALALIGILSGGSSQGDLSGPYRDHQLYGSVLLLLLPFTAGTALSAPSASWRWGALASLTAGALCLFLSETRSAWFGLAAAGLVFGGLRLKLLFIQQPLLVKALQAKWTALVPPTVLVSGLLLGLLSIWLLSSPADQKAALLARAATLLALGHDPSWQSRLQLWRGTAQLVEAHPLLGIGLGRYPGAEWRWTHAGGLLLPNERPSLTNEAHSLYGQTAAETGLPGLALYLAALAAFAASALRRLTPSRRRRHSFSGQNALVIAAASALAGQSVDALASPSWQFPEASLLFWAVLGLGLASLRREMAPADAPLPAPLRQAGRWALSGGLAVALAAQILPMGLLLTPVEAYTSPAGWTLASLTVTYVVSPAGNVAAGSVVQFTVIANYKDPLQNPVTVDVTKDPGTVYSATITHTSGTTGAVAFTNGKFTVPLGKTYTAGSTLTVTIAYYDSRPGAGNRFYTSPAISIQPA